MTLGNASSEDTMKYHYCVLYTPVLKQQEVQQFLQDAIPEGRGIAFYPCVELWWHGSETTVLKPLFPGYIFVRSDLSPMELHEIIKDSKSRLSAFIREFYSGTTAPVLGPDGQVIKEAQIDFITLSDEESNFMDFMLNFQNTTEDGKKDGFPEYGVIRMSRGYEAGGKVVVVEGPLRGYESHIIGVKKRDRKAYLDISINGHPAKVGLELYPKSHFKDVLPDGEAAADKLSDGEAVDVSDLAKSMMQRGVDSDDE